MKFDMPLNQRSNMHIWLKVIDWKSIKFNISSRIDTPLEKKALSLTEINIVWHKDRKIWAVIDN